MDWDMSGFVGESNCRMSRCSGKGIFNDAEIRYWYAIKCKMLFVCPPKKQGRAVGLCLLVLHLGEALWANLSKSLKIEGIAVGSLLCHVGDDIVSHSILLFYCSLFICVLF